MDKNELIAKIRVRDPDVEWFANKIIEDDGLRNEVISQLISNKDIMVYYHCYYVLSRASELRPELFYPFWHDFARLIHHKNSYHRDIGATILTNLVNVDTERRFDTILEDYILHIQDAKLMTAQCFVRNLEKVVLLRKDLVPRILSALLTADRKSTFPEKQMELLKCDILKVIEAVYSDYEDKKPLDDFIQAAINSRSPKTKKKAKELVTKSSTE